MKKTFGICLFVLVLALSACGTKTQPQNLETLPLTAMGNPQTDAVVELGMTKTQVDTLLGEATYLDPEAYYAAQWEQEGDTGYENAARGIIGQRPEKEYSYGKDADFLVVTYRDDLVISMTTNHIFAQRDLAPFNWCLRGGVGYGQGDEAIQAAIGEREPIFDQVSQDGRHYRLYEYSYDAQGKSLPDNAEATLCVSITLDGETGEIISLGVYKVEPPEPVTYNLKDSEAGLTTADLDAVQAICGNFVNDFYHALRDIEAIDLGQYMANENLMRYIYAKIAHRAPPQDGDYDSVSVSTSQQQWQFDPVGISQTMEVTVTTRNADGTTGGFSEAHEFLVTAAGDRMVIADWYCSGKGQGDSPEEARPEQGPLTNVGLWDDKAFVEAIFLELGLVEG